jgi:hypothetical protein
LRLAHESAFISAPRKAALPMPKADPPDSDLYEIDISTRKEAIESIVRETKWIVELVSLLALNTGLSTVFMLLMHQLFSSDPSPKLLCGIGATFVLCWLVFWPSARAVELAGEALVIKGRAFLRIPYDLEHRHSIFRSAWHALFTMVHILATWGVAFMLAELLKDSKLLG